MWPQYLFLISCWSLLSCHIELQSHDNRLTHCLWRLRGRLEGCITLTVESITAINSRNPRQETEWTPGIDNISYLWTPDRNLTPEATGVKIINLSSQTARKRSERLLTSDARDHLWTDKGHDSPPWAATYYHVTVVQSYFHHMMVTEPSPWQLTKLQKW